MHRSTLITIGPLKTSWIKEGCREYERRMQDLQIIELSPSKQKDPVKQSQEESQKILDALEKIDGEVWVLDERGKEMTSELFASSLSALCDQGRSIVFVLGGAFGLTDAVRSEADRVFALSPMTFPHELCRLIFLEQLYRAKQIQKGRGYHH